MREKERAEPEVMLWFPAKVEEVDEVSLKGMGKLGGEANVCVYKIIIILDKECWWDLGKIRSR